MCMFACPERSSASCDGLKVDLTSPHCFHAATLRQVLTLYVYAQFSAPAIIENCWMVRARWCLLTQRLRQHRRLGHGWAWHQICPRQFSIVTIPAMIRDGAPSYLILIDSLVAGSPDNSMLLAQSAELHSAYAGAFVEDPARAARLHRKAKAQILRVYLFVVKGCLWT